MNAVDVLLKGGIRDLSVCRCINTALASTGSESHAFIADHLIRSFTVCESLVDANRVFSKVQMPSLYTWNAIVSAYGKLGTWDACVAMYVKLYQESLLPDKCTFHAILNACSVKGTVGEGMLIHDHVINNGVESEEVIVINLIRIYIKSGCLEDARVMFEGLPSHNVVSWNVMISGYSQNGKYHQALELFIEMLSKSVAPDSVTFATIVKVCSNISEKDYGMVISSQVIKLGMESDVVVGSSLLDFHVKCGNLGSAFAVFQKIENPNVVSWNSILVAHCQSQNAVLAFQMFGRMLQHGINPDKVTFLSIMKVCCTVKDVNKSKMIYNMIIEYGFESDMTVCNTIIYMYVKLGQLQDAQNTFDKMQNRDIVSWNVLLSGYAEDANLVKTLTLFEKMKIGGIEANEFTYACVIKVCGETGSVDLGKVIHEEMIKKNVKIDLTLGNVLIDMYSKCGKPETAHVVHNELPIRDSLSWNALITGYAHVGNVKMVDWCLINMQLDGFKPNGGTFTNIIAACGHMGQVKVGTWYFQCMQHKYNIIPNNEHLNSLVDLLARSGCLNEAEDLLKTMPFQPDITGWSSLLTGCKNYGDATTGTQCFEKGVQLDPNGSGIYVLLSDIYRDAQMFKDLFNVTELKKNFEAWKIPGKAWIHLSDTKVHEFIVGDKSHELSESIYSKLSRIKSSLGNEGYVPILPGI